MQDRKQIFIFDFRVLRANINDQICKIIQMSNLLISQQRLYGLLVKELLIEFEIIPRYADSNG